MEAVRHSLFDNSVQLYRRPKTPLWWCSCTVGGKQQRASTKEESLSRAKDVARDWYLGLLGKYRAGGLREGKKFREAAEQFMDEFETITQGQRSEVYVDAHRLRIKNHLNPFFGEMVLSEITAGRIQDYRIHRMKNGMSRSDQHRLSLLKRKRESTANFQRLKPPSRSTLHQEIVCLRQVLKAANRQGWLDHLPNLAAPFQQSGKIVHRAWFSPEEYKSFYLAARERAQKPKHEKWRWSSEQLYDFILFMANTGLRPDEAYRIEFRDVEIEDDYDTKKTILVIKVRGKRGVGYCKSMPGAVEPFRRLQKRPRPAFLSGTGSQDTGTNLNLKTAKAKSDLTQPKPTDLVFPRYHHDLFNEILNKLGMKKDREGNERTAYSLRHTYISMRLSEGANIYDVAKNCRTSVEMIEKYYASHLKDRVNVAAINVRKKRRRQPAKQK